MTSANEFINQGYATDEAQNKAIEQFDGGENYIIPTWLIVLVLTSASVLIILSILIFSANKKIK